MLEKANNQAEHFERHWYLRGDEIESLQARVDQLVGMVRENRIPWIVKLEQENAHLQSLLDAVGAGGVEPLRKAKCLHQIQEPQPIPSNPGELELKSPANIDSPFNACIYQEHCKR